VHGEKDSSLSEDESRWRRRKKGEEHQREEEVLVQSVRESTYSADERRSPNGKRSEQGVHLFEKANQKKAGKRHLPRKTRKVRIQGCMVRRGIWEKKKESSNREKSAIQGDAFAP